MAFFWCVLAATSIGICFKLFPLWKIDTFHAIVINYTTCLLLGLLFDPGRNELLSWETFHQPWFKFDILLGILFITGFTLTAYAVLQLGITLTVLMQKMSILLTVSFAVLIFRENISMLEGLGLLMALIAIVTINLKPDKSKKISARKRWLLLGSVLLLSAMIEIVLFYVQKMKIVTDQHMLFTSIGFGIAALIGWIIIFIKRFDKKTRLTWKDIAAGITLGLPNYFSIYLILVMLHNGWKGSILYPMLNVSILLLSTILALIIFHEKLRRANWIGVVCSILAILLISYAQNQSTWKMNF